MQHLWSSILILCLGGGTVLAAADGGRPAELADRQRAIATTLERLRARQARVLPDGAAVRAGLQRILDEEQGRNATGFMLRRPDVENAVNDRMFVNSPSALDCLRSFHAQLQARGIDLIVVPVPNQIMVHGHALFAGVDPDHYLWPAYTAGLIRLLEAGVEVVDLVPEFQAYAGEDVAIQRYDHHWGTAGMRIAAAELTRRLQRYAWARAAVAQRPRFTTRPLTVPMPSELLAHNGIVPYPRWNKGERVAWMPATYRARQVLFDGEPLQTQPWSQEAFDPVLVMGDSTVFHLSWQHGGESAGFPEHLSAALGMRVSQRAKAAGGPTTAVRYAKEFATRSPPPAVLVLSLVTADLATARWPVANLPALPADQVVAEATPPAAVLAVQGELLEMPELPDPARANYAEAIGIMRLRLRGPAGGSPAGAEILVARWFMRDNALLPVAQLRPGEMLELRLVTWDAAQAAQPALVGQRLLYPSEGLMLPMYWASADD